MPRKKTKEVNISKKEIIDSDYKEVSVDCEQSEQTVDIEQSEITVDTDYKEVTVDCEQSEQTVDFNEIMEKNYIDYAMSIITDRALADVRDNCKPVQRRVIYAMKELNLQPDKPFRKCARIVGDCMGKYHPHGDSSIYGALVNMAQDFKMNIPLIEGHGNFGSIDGDGCAASRYTEARLSELGWSLCENLNPEIVPFVPNFDESETEPTILPCKIPAVLLNGNDGIAVGMKSYIPPHNLSELLDASAYLLKKPKATITELMEYIKGPDFPTGGIIVNQKDLLDIYSTGVGKITVRAKIKKETGKAGKTNLVITEIPYSMTGRKSALIQELITAVKNRVLDEISDIRDESNKNEIRVVLEVKKDVDVNQLLNKLYIKTKLQDNISCNFLVLNNQEPFIMNLKQYLEIYLEFQKELIINETNLSLKKALKRLEIVDGLIFAIQNIDAIIDTIRNSKTVTLAKKCLTTGDITGITFKLAKNKTIASKFHFSEVQAQAILDMKLQRLCGLEIKTLEKEKKELEKNIAKYNKILSNKSELNKKISELLMALKKYSVERKTVITNKTTEKIVEKKVVSDITIAIDRFLYAKVLDGTQTCDNMKYVLHGKSDEKLCVFTDKGNLYQIKIDTIPKGKMKDKGSPLDVLCKFKEHNENILLLSTDKELMNKQIIFLLKSGYLKQVSYKEYISNYKCIVATKLYDSELIGILAVTSKETITIKTNKRELKIKLDSFEKHTKGLKGNKCITFRKDEEILKLI